MTISCCLASNHVATHPLLFCTMTWLIVPWAMFVCVVKKPTNQKQLLHCSNGLLADALSWFEVSNFLPSATMLAKSPVFQSAFQVSSSTASFRPKIISSMSSGFVWPESPQEHAPQWPIIGILFVHQHCRKGAVQHVVNCAAPGVFWHGAVGG